MIMDYKKLFHDEVAFQHETLETRMQNYGFKNMGRMELFLWDLAGPDCPNLHLGTGL